MNEISVQKCRACLKRSKKSFPLTKYATRGNPRKTFGHLLQECAMLKCSPDYEHLMPQFLCLTCCRGLRRTYAFINQAQYYNNKLVNIISKNQDCLQESTIDLPEKEEDLPKYHEIKVEESMGDFYTIYQKEPSASKDEFISEEPNVLYEESKDNTMDCNHEIEEIKLVENETSVQKCRTCLKRSTKSFPLTKYSRRRNPRKTFGQLLQECAMLKCSPDYEHLMPQFLCLTCCRELRSTYAFIKQAQYCNNKNVNIISKNEDCLQENTIDLSEKEEDLPKYHEIIVEESMGDFYTIYQKEPSASKDELISEEPNVLHEESEDNTMDCNHETEEIKLVDNEISVSNNRPFETSSESYNNTIVDHLLTKCACPMCRKHLSTRSNLIKHMRVQHNIENPSKLLDKSKPRQKQQKDKIIKCRSCDYTAKTSAAFDYHIRSKHGTEQDKFKCNFCTRLFLNKLYLLRHVKKSHKEIIKSLKAETENKSEAISNTTVTLTASKLETKDLRHENEESSSDDYVPLFQKRDKAYSTLNSNNEMGECADQFSDEEFIRNMLNMKKRQTKSSSKSLPRRCEECGNIYKNYKALYAHQRNVHISEDKYSLCSYCGKKYKRETDLRIHIQKTHISKNSAEIINQPAKVREKRFMCTECSYVCATKTVLNIHINRHHTGEKPYKCDICFKSFIVSYDLKIHRYIHTGERPYKCSICWKPFRDHSHMLKHKRTHSSEPPFKCKECGKCFTQSYNLSVHKRTHLKEKLNCAVCGKVFQNRYLLNMHRIKEDHHDDI